MTEERPTPETDAVDGKPTWQENIIEKGWVPADFTRRLERERDEARERADTMFAKHAEILDQYRRERDAERALADRLADCLNNLWHYHSLTEESYDYIDAPLAAWKEARSE